MKKTIFVLCIAAAGLAACGGGAKTGADGKVEVSSKEDANKIIGYTNDVLDVVKESNETVEKNIKYYGEILKQASGQTVYGMIKPFSSFNSSYNKSKANAFAEPTASLGDNQQFFKDSMGLYKTLYTTFFQQDSVLKTYIDGEDFKDDHYAKAKDIIGKQMAIYPQMIRLRSALSVRIETVADVAEELVLKDDPLKDAYIAAKNDMKKLKAVVNAITDKENYTDADLAGIDSTYSILLAGIEKSKAISKTELDKQHKTNIFNDLYERYTEASTKLKAVIRNIKASKKLTEDDYDDVNRIYEGAISLYNIWVN